MIDTQHFANNDKSTNSNDNNSDDDDSNNNSNDDEDDDGTKVEWRRRKCGNNLLFLLSHNHLFLLTLIQCLIGTLSSSAFKARLHKVFQRRKGLLKKSILDTGSIGLCKLVKKNFFVILEIFGVSGLGEF